MKLKEIYFGYYSTGVYLPFSALARRWRAFLKSRRRNGQRFQQDTNLPKITWKELIQPDRIRIVEHQKENGNVRISELGVLLQASRHCEDGTFIFEIGTFDRVPVCDSRRGRNGNTRSHKILQQHAPSFEPGVFVTHVI